MLNFVFHKNYNKMIKLMKDNYIDFPYLFIIMKDINI